LDLDPSQLTSETVLLRHRGTLTPISVAPYQDLDAHIRLALRVPNTMDVKIMSVYTTSAEKKAMVKGQGGKSVSGDIDQAHVAVLEVEQVQSEVLRLQGVIRRMW
jgi:hypothetical protein